MCMQNDPSLKSDAKVYPHWVHECHEVEKVHTNVQIL